MYKSSRYALASLACFSLLAAFTLQLPSSFLHNLAWVWLALVFFTLCCLLGVLHLQNLRRIRSISRQNELSESRLRALRVAIERSPTSILVTDPKGNIEYANPTLCHFTGYSVEELIGKNSSIFNSGKTPRATHDDLWQTLSRGKCWNGRFISQTKNGETYQEQAWIAPVLNEKHELTNYVAVKLDVTEHEHTLERMHLHNQVLDQLSRSQPTKNIFKTIIHAVEKAMPELNGAVFLRSLDGTTLELSTAPSLPSFFTQVLQQLVISTDGICPSQAAFYGKRIINQDLSTQARLVKSADAALRAGLHSCWAEPIFDLEGNVSGVLCFFQEQAAPPAPGQLCITEHAASLVHLVIERSQNNALLKLAETVYSTSSEAIAVTDANGTFIHVNPAFTQITGYSANEVIGRDHSVLKSGRHSKEFYQEMWGSLNSTGSWQGEIWNKRKSGEIYPQYLSINSTYDTDGSVKFRISLFADISKQKANEELIWRQANFDALTGLANRRYFQEVFQHELKVAQRSNQRLAIIFIDLDEFKPINDKFGHHYGDELLAQTALRIKAPLRDTDIVARIGGDEFVVLLAGNPSQQDAITVARRIHEQVLQPFEIDGQRAQISLSCGISMYPDAGNTLSELIRHADMAMYQAKSHGRNQTVFFESSLMD